MPCSFGIPRTMARPNSACCSPVKRSAGARSVQGRAKFTFRKVINLSTEEFDYTFGRYSDYVKISVLCRNGAVLFTLMA